MKRFVFTILLGAALGAAGFWFLSQPAGKTSVEAVSEHAREGVEKAKEAVGSRVPDIRVEDIKEELAKGGLIVREKAAKVGQVIADSTADARISARLKAKLLAEPEIASLGVHVSTTDGITTLSGKVKSPEQVAKALQLALETEGVQKVFSTLQVDGAKN